jgi:hypothetical protein
VKVIAWRGETEVASFEVKGPVDDVAALAGDIVKQARAHIPR